MKKVLGWLLLLAILGGLIWLIFIKTEYTDPVAEGPVEMGDFTCVDGDWPEMVFDGSFYATWEFDLYPTGEIADNGTWSSRFNLSAYAFGPHGTGVDITAHKAPLHVTLVVTRPWDGETPINTTKRGWYVHLGYDETVVGYGRSINGDSEKRTELSFGFSDARIENLVYTRGGSYSVRPSRWSSLIFFTLLPAAVFACLLYIASLQGVLKRLGSLEGRGWLPVSQILLVISGFLLCSTYFPDFRDWAVLWMEKYFESNILTAPYLAVCEAKMAVYPICGVVFILALGRQLRFLRRAKQKGLGLFLLMLLNLVAIVAAVLGIYFIVVFILALVQVVFGLARQLLALGVILIYLFCTQTVFVEDADLPEWMIWF